MPRPGDPFSPSGPKNFSVADSVVRTLFALFADRRGLAQATRSSPGATQSAQSRSPASFFATTRTARRLQRSQAKGLALRAEAARFTSSAATFLAGLASSKSSQNSTRPRSPHASSHSRTPSRSAFGTARSQRLYVARTFAIASAFCATSTIHFRCALATFDMSTSLILGLATPGAALTAPWHLRFYGRKPQRSTPAPHFCRML